MKVAILTDSNSGIKQDEAKKLGIFVLPMPVLINEDEFYEDIDLTQDQFYQKLSENAEVSTSQPSLFTIGEKWEELLKNHDEIVYIPMSSSLSSGCENAVVYSKEFGGRVEVANNRRISVTQKQSVYDAIKLRELGRSAKEIKTYLEENSQQSSIYIMVDTLKYLKKGGRLTPAVAALAGMLRIKPILQIQGGKLDKFSQVMTAVQGKKKMIDQICKELESRFEDALKENKIVVSMAYTNCIQKAEEFKCEVNSAISKYNLKVEYMDPLPISISCHIGSGALAVTISEKF